MISVKIVLDKKIAKIPKVILESNSKIHDVIRQRMKSPNDNLLHLQLRLMKKGTKVREFLTRIGYLMKAGAILITDKKTDSSNTKRVIKLPKEMVNLKIVKEKLKVQGTNLGQSRKKNKSQFCKSKKFYKEIRKFKIKPSLDLEITKSQKHSKLLRKSKSANLCIQNRI